MEDMYASHMSARVVNTRIALATTQKGNMTIAEYVGKMKALGDEIASASKPIDDEELVGYILTCLDMEYSSIVFAVLAPVEPISVNELYAQLLSFEQRVDFWQRRVELLGERGLASWSWWHAQRLGWTWTWPVPRAW